MYLQTTTTVADRGLRHLASSAMMEPLKSQVHHEWRLKKIGSMKEKDQRADFHLLSLLMAYEDCNNYPIGFVASIFDK
jgi:hypothetical protein